MELTEAARGAVRARNPPAELGLGTLRLGQMASSDCEGATEVRVVSTTSSEMGYRGVTPRAERPDAPGDSPAGVRARSGRAPSPWLPKAFIIARCAKCKAAGGGSELAPKRLGRTPTKAGARANTSRVGARVTRTRVRDR
jgi:hypothetical protein